MGALIINMIMSLRTAVMVVLCMSVAIANDTDQVVPEAEQFSDVLPMYQFVQGDADATDEKKIDPMEPKSKMMFEPVDVKMPRLPTGKSLKPKLAHSAPLLLLPSPHTSLTT